jgi:peptidoglycan/LPS O-acetylase OafA/YrhL
MGKSVGNHNRRDIQYLRALAVVSVVAHHFWPSRLASGFLGVDVFFVISGFLISSLILREVRATGTIRLTAFWVRRIRRIFPAAITVIIATAVTTFLSGSTAHIVTIGRHIFASSFSFENVLLGLDATDYDRRGEMTSPLQHYWSLSVEEQFYLAWPIIIIGAVWLATKSGVSVIRLLGIAVVVIGTVSLVYAIVVAQGFSSYYFDTLARAWELAIGAAVALLAQRDRTPWRGQFIVNRLSWISLGMTFAIPGLGDFAPGIGILPAVIATACILASGPVSAPKSLPFSTPIRFVSEWVGDRSYSIYLWHWPILILLPLFLGSELSTASKIGALVLILVLAELTYLFVENPVRHAKASWTFNPLFVGSIAMVTSVAVVAAVAVVPLDLGKKEATADLSTFMLAEPVGPRTPRSADKFPYTAPYCDGAGAAVFNCPNSTEVQFDASAYPPLPPASRTCRHEEQRRINDCIVGDISATRSIALIGDSHARAMWASLDLIGQRAGYAVHEFLAPNCSYRVAADDWCNKRNHDVRLRINSGEFDLVILAQSSRFVSTGGKNPLPSANPYVELFGELKSNGINIAVVKDNPRRGEALLSCINYTARDPGSCTSHSRPRMDLATQTAINLGIPIVNLDDAYCPDSRCAAVRGGMFVWKDKAHIWTFYQLTAAPLIWSQLMEFKLIHPQR